MNSPSNLTKFQRVMLQRIFRSAFRQSQFHRKNLVEVYRLIQEALDKEFTEDNHPTLDSFSIEAFEESLRKKRKG